MTRGMCKLWACTGWLRAISALPRAPWGRVGYPARAGNLWGMVDNLCVWSSRVLDPLK